MTMFGALPDLTPRDSRSWYVSSRPPSQLPYHLRLGLSSAISGSADHNGPGGANAISNHHAVGINNIGNISNNNNINNVNNGLNGGQATQGGGGGGGGGPSGRRSRGAQRAIIERSELGRMRAEEAYADRRRANIGNLGCGWLRPPGIAKTLLQLREERREQLEHAEALRREQLAQELADAEEEAANADARRDMMTDGGDMDDDPEEDDEDEDEDEQMMDEGGDGMRDLDAEIPDADEGGFGYDGATDDGEEVEEEEDGENGQDVDDEDDDDNERRAGDDATVSDASHAGDEDNEDFQMAAAARANEDRQRELMTRGALRRASDGADLMYGAPEEEIVAAEDQAHMLEEDDLVVSGSGGGGGGGGAGNMNVNLDDDIPEAEYGGYEHTDSEASMLSSDDADGEDAYDGPNTSYAPPSIRVPRQQQQQQQAPRYRASQARASDGPRTSLDISSMLSMSGAGSSTMGSSPNIRRR